MLCCSCKEQIMDPKVSISWFRAIKGCSPLFLEVDQISLHCSTLRPGFGDLPYFPCPGLATRNLSFTSVRSCSDRGKLVKMAPRAVVHSLVQLPLWWYLFAFCSSSRGGGVLVGAASDWADAHATFYGGKDASGTMGGACGYGNLYSTGYGTSSTALSSALFNNGLSCGACFHIQCKLDGSKWCYSGGRSIIVTATNACPPGSDGGWCDPPRSHFDLSYPMFQQLAEPVAGVIPVQYKRVPCQKQGGIRFGLNGNPWFDLVLVTNVGGGGDVAQLEIKGSNTDWCPMNHSWGQNWHASGHPELCGQSISFRVTLGDGRSLAFLDVAPSFWGYGQTFESDTNFY